MENKLVPKEGFPIFHVDVMGFQRKLTPENIKKNIRAAYLAVNSVGKAKKLLRDFKPDIVIGSGGYVSWPVLRAAAKLGIPTLIHEQNTFPGVTTVMRTGSEYTNISPLLDYSFIPGTTAVPETDEEIAAHPDATYRLLPGVYGGAAADGAAVSFAKTKHEGISMTVSCFATDDAAILLGAGMTNDAGKRMFTTLDQSYYAGSFVRDGNTVLHNGIKYELLEGGALTAEPAHRTGSWRRNNLTLADIPAEGDIFTVYAENTGSYAYTVMAEGTDAQFEVIVNTPTLQAVRLPDGRIAAAFFAKGSFAYDGNTYKGSAGTAKIFE